MSHIITFFPPNDIIRDDNINNEKIIWNGTKNYGIILWLVELLYQKIQLAKISLKEMNYYKFTLQ